MPLVSIPLAISGHDGVSLRIDTALGSVGAQRKRRRKWRRQEDQALGFGGEVPCICEGVEGFDWLPRKAQHAEIDVRCRHASPEGIWRVEL